MVEPDLRGAADAVTGGTADVSAAGRASAGECGRGGGVRRAERSTRLPGHDPNTNFLACATGHTGVDTPADTRDPADSGGTALTVSEPRSGRSGQRRRWTPRPVEASNPVLARLCGDPGVTSVRPCVCPPQRTRGRVAAPRRPDR